MIKLLLPLSRRERGKCEKIGKADQAEISPKFYNCGSLEGSGDMRIQATNWIEVFHSEQFTQKGTAVKLFRHPCLPLQLGAIREDLWEAE
jgi:hypothetical protein